MDISQLDAIIESSVGQGMISMGQYAKKLIEKGIIHPKDVERIFKSKEESL